MTLWKNGKCYNRLRFDSYFLGKIHYIFTNWNSRFYPVKNMNMIKRIIKRWDIIIIYGSIGVGKSILAEQLSKFYSDLIIIEVQNINEIFRIIRLRALKIIKIENMEV